MSRGHWLLCVCVLHQIITNWPPWQQWHNQSCGFLLGFAVRLLINDLFLWFIRRRLLFYFYTLSVTFLYLSMLFSFVSLFDLNQNPFNPTFSGKTLSNIHCNYHSALTVSTRVSCQLSTAWRLLSGYFSPPCLALHSFLGLGTNYNLWGVSQFLVE